MARLWTPMSILIRLSLYYILYLLIWGCPINVDLNQDSPAGCRQIHLCVDKIKPVISSQYQVYLEPRVKELSPYITKSHNVYSKYGQPVVDASSTTYKKFGHPYVLSASKSAHQVYKSHIHPILHSWGAKTQSLYNLHLANHVDNGYKLFQSSLQRPAAHYLLVSRQAYNAKIAPIVSHLEPHLKKGVTKSLDFTQSHVIPALRLSIQKSQYYAHLAYVKIITFYLETVHPKTIHLYQHHVEPQFLKIQNRIFNPQKSPSLSSTSSIILSSSPSPSPSPSSSSSTVVVEASSTISQESQQQPISTPPDTDAVAQSIKHDMKHMQNQIKDLTESAKEDVTREFNQLMQSKLHATSQAAAAAVKEFRKQTEQLLLLLETNAANIQDEQEFTHLRTDVAVKIRDLALSTKTQAKELVVSFSTEAQQIKYSVWESLNEVANIALKQLAEKWTWTEGVKWEDWKGYHSLKKFVADAEDTVIGLDLDLSPIDNIGDEVNNAVNQETAKVIERIEAVKSSWYQRFQPDDDDESGSKGSSILSNNNNPETSSQAETEQEISPESTPDGQDGSPSQNEQIHLAGDSQDDEQVVIQNDELPIPEPTEEGLVEQDQDEDLIVEETPQDEELIEIDEDEEQQETITSRIIRTVYVPNKSSSAEGTIPSGQDEKYTGDIIQDLSVSTFSTA